MPSTPANSIRGVEFCKKIDQVVQWRPGCLIETFQKKNKPGRLIETGRSFVTRHKIEMDLVV